MSKKPYEKKKFSQESHDSSSICSEQSEDLNVNKEKYTAEKLMMMLDRQKLAALEAEFNEYPKGIELHNFVWLMKSAINISSEEKAELVMGLYHLFQEIDINGDEHVEWQELIQYIIDIVMSRQLREKSSDKEFTPGEILDQTYSLKSRRYKLSKVIDRNAHSNYISYLFYIPSLDLITYIDAHSQVVKSVDIKTEAKFQIAPVIPSSTFAISAAYSKRDSLFVVSCSDKCFYIYEKDREGFRFWKKLQTPHTHTSLWYFEKLKIWVSTCEDYALRQWDLRTGHIIGVYKGHTKEIMDAIEISVPLSFASCSLDGIIIIWNLKDRSPLGTLAGEHKRGVRCLDYCTEAGGNLISVGYEREISVWCPEIKLAKCFIGKLEGHTSPVVSAKFFKGRPMCISVEEKGNIRVWDVRQLCCLQVICNEKGNVNITKLVTVQRYDKFIVAGKRMITFEVDSNNTDKEIYCDAKPISIVFNSHYMQIAVLTRYDMRIYDCTTGRLQKIFTEVNEIGSEIELTALALDGRNRVFITGDSSGALSAYNFSNGVLISPVRKLPKPLGKLQTKPSHKSVSLTSLQSSKVLLPKSINPALKNLETQNYSGISSTYFCNEDKILISASWGSTIMLYDMKNVENITLLRYLEGGHEGSDITIIAYSPYLNLIASGSSNGIISIWDFETGKLSGAFFHHKREITSLIFLDPFPVLLSNSNDAVMCLWNCTKGKITVENMLIARIKNFSWTGTGFNKAAVLVGANVQCQRTAIRKEMKKKYEKVKKVNGNKKENSENEDESCYEWVEEKQEKVPQERDCNELKEREYLYLGDAAGFVKVLSFQKFFRVKGILPLKISEKNEENYNPRRRDTVNAETELKYWKRLSESKAIPEFIDTTDGIFIKEWQGHNAAINCMKTISDPQGIITTSLDKILKLWSSDGEIWGIINLISAEIPKNWYFPYDWEAKRQSEVSKVIKVLSLIDGKIETDLNFNFIDRTQVKKREKEQNIPKKPKKHEESSWKIPEKRVFVHSHNLSIEEDPLPQVKETVQKSYDGSVADLKKKLDEIDEKRLKDTILAESSELPRKMKNSKRKPNLQHTNSDYLKIRASKRLPKIQITSTESQEIIADFEKNSKRSSIQTFNEVKNPHTQKDFKGRSIFGNLHFQMTFNIGNSLSSTSRHENLSKKKSGESKTLREIKSVQDLFKSIETSPMPKSYLPTLSVPSSRNSK